MYLLKSKGDVLSLFQSFVQSVVIPSGSRVERLRADKGDEYINTENMSYLLSSDRSVARVRQHQHASANRY